MSWRQTMPSVARVYTLPRCSVALYTTGANDTLGTLTWVAQSVDNLRVSERYDEVDDTPTGVPYPETHHMAERHELMFDAIWNVSARLARNTEYILVVTWQDANLGPTTRAWVRRTYIGITTSSRDISSRDANEFTSSNVLRAKYYTESTGSTAPTGMTPGATNAPGDSGEVGNVGDPSNPGTPVDPSGLEGGDSAC